jgi:hypothetical protein
MIICRCRNLRRNAHAQDLFRRPRHRLRSRQAGRVRCVVLREHLPDAVKSFGAEKAWRFWSLSDPSLHQASYQFADQAALDRAMDGEDLKRLIADFNRDWPDVTRTRDLMVLAEEFGAA